MQLLPPLPHLNLRLPLYMIPLGNIARQHLFPILYNLRQRALRCEMGKEDASLKSQMKRADRLGARYVLIVGENEINRGSAVLRDMATKKQTDVAFKGLSDVLLSTIGLSGERSPL